MDESSRFRRRDFALGLVAGTACLTNLTAGTANGDQTPQKPSDSKPAQKGDEEKRPIEEARPEPPAELLLLSYLVREFPNENFDKDALAGIFRDIRGDVARGRTLRDFPLKNSDEPAFAFRAGNW